MAIRFKHRVRPALVAVSLVATAVAVPAVASAAPSAPRQEPTIDQVEKKLGTLAMTNSQLVEQYNQARVKVQKLDAKAGAAQRAAAVASSQYRTAKLTFARNVQQQYLSGDLGAAGALFDSESGPNYLDRLNTLDLISTYDANIVSRLQSTRADAKSKADDAEQALAGAKRERNALGSKRDAVRKKIDEYRNLLATLTARQQARYERQTNPTVAKKTWKDLPIKATASAKRAVEFALAQVGEPYVFGAAGPDAWDCSGLTQGAWAAGGVSLPHSAADQYNYGTHVGLDQLSPGDLIFMYQPIGHVTIYIGDGMMVSAPTEGQPVQVVPVSQFSGDIVGATHLA
ncbi:C40 family peptidase [Jatrophihabitans fulvus]